ncbi:uncharacterized protein LOC135835944 isoform X2 [Planococcus citri]|uniref:uncharacterized protein LOC135835944 isoform X2 n=1 Tax=Planococcus citri TaxID=170843 RepID=UPI0031F830F3
MENSNSFKISNTSAGDKESTMHSSLQQYYHNVMENTKLSSIKIDRAARFLLLPEIANLTGDHTKAMFLLSKGLTHDEVSEAFKLYYREQKGALVTIFQPDVAELALNNVSQTDNNSLACVSRKHPNDTPSGLSIFFNLCQRVMVLAGISTAFYYLYQNTLLQKWRADKAKENKTKKEHKRIEEELNQIKSELQKITAELKLQQLTGKTNANLAAEINSLKAILVSRQHFEELQNKKVSLPSWQLNASKASNSPEINAINNTDVIVSNGGSECTPSPCDSSPIVQEKSNESIKIESNEKNTPNDIQISMNGSTEGEEKIVISNVSSDSVSDTIPKTKKTNTKNNKNSKSKVGLNDKENGKTLKQNGVVRINSD